MCRRAALPDSPKPERARLNGPAHPHVRAARAEAAPGQLGKLREVLVDERVALAAEAVQPVLDVGRVARLAHLAVVDDVEAALDLAPHDLVHRRADTRGQRYRVHRHALLAREHRPDQVGRPGQAAGVRGQEPLRAPLHGANSNRYPRAGGEPGRPLTRRRRARTRASGSMSKTLSREAIERYRRDGFLFPVRVLSPAEAGRYRERLEAVERAQGGPLRGELRHKTHLLFTWLDALVRHPVILDAVEDILGPNLMVWSSSFFIKEARDPAFVSWHQDATYWGLSEPDVATTWVAFTDSSIVRGVDEYGHFQPEQPPEADLAPAAVAQHATIMKRQGEILYRGTAGERFR